MFRLLLQFEARQRPLHFARVHSILPGVPLAVTPASGGLAHSIGREKNYYLQPYVH
jgi:hypothetical protein